MVFSDQDITSIIQDVERQVLGIASDTLKKGEGSKSASAGAPPDDGGGLPPGAGEESSSSGSGSSASPADAGDPSAPPAPPAASAAASPAMDPSASAGAPPPGGDPAASAAGAPPPGQDPGMGDHEALVSEFAKMPPEHVAQILEAAKQVLLAQQPAGAGPAPSPNDPSAPPAGLAQSEVGEGGLDAGVPAGQGGKQVPANGKASGLQEVASNGGKPMSGGQPESGNMHSNLSGDGGVKTNTTVKAEGGNVLSPPPESGDMHANLSGDGGVKTNTTIQTHKAEVDAELAQLRKANEDLNLKLERLIGITQEIVEKPVRKAVTGLDYSPKPTQGQAAPLPTSPKEITRRLTEKVQDPSLSKSDRQLINDFYDRRIDVSKIEHLLK